MSFASYWWFLVLPLLLFLFWRSRGSAKALTFSSLTLLGRAKSAFNPRWVTDTLRAVAILLVLIALARPQSGKVLVEESTDGVDILIALDTSGSMKALDFEWEGKRVNRLNVVKRVVSTFIEKRQADRIGLVVFGEEAYTQSPLTSDHRTLQEFLEGVHIGMAGDATAIGSAIGVAVKRMKDIEAKSKILVLLTDGLSNAGEVGPIKAAEVASTYGIKIYTIGVGKNAPAPFPMDTFIGTQLMYQTVPLDEETLKKVANLTGGKYFRATDAAELSGIYEEIDQLEKTEAKTKKYTEYTEWYRWFVALALAIIAAEVVLANSRLRTIP